MKNTRLVTLFVLFGAMAPIGIVAQSLTLGTNTVSILFEDDGLPAANQNLIAADLTEAFGWADSLQTAFETAPGAPLGFGHVREPFDMAMPSDLWDGICLTNTPSGLRCLVTRALSGAHATRLAQFSGHFADIVALRARVDAANSADFNSLPLQEKADFFWHGGTVPENVTPEQRAAFETQVIPMLRNYIVHPPSIFRLSGSQVADGDTATLVGWCVFVPRSGTNAKIEAVPVGLVNGQWKFFFGL